MRGRTIALRAGWCCLTTVALVVISRLIHPRNLLDLEVYRKGAWAFVHGRNPFGSGLPGPGLPFTYTPFSTIAFAPLALIPLGLATVAHTFVSLLALVAVVVLVLVVLNRSGLDGSKLSGPRLDRSRLDRSSLEPTRLLQVASGVTLALFFSEPVLQTLYFGQINLVLMAMIMFDLLALRSRRFSGVLVGIAAGIKLTPLVFVLYLLAIRRYRAALTAAVSAAGTVALGWVLMPGPSHQYFFDLMWDARRVGNVNYVGNQSLDGMWTRLLHGYAAAKPFWAVSAAVVLAVGIWTAAQIHQRFGELAGIAVCAITGLLVSPISWSHHWVWFFIPALVVAHAAWTRRSAVLAGIAAVWTVLFYVAPFWFVPHKHHRTYPHGWIQQIQASSYVIVALVALAVTAAALARSRWRPAIAIPADEEPIHSQARHRVAS